MLVTAHVDPDDGIAYYSATGDLTRDEILSVIDQVYGDPEYRAPWRSVWEMKGARPVLDASEVRAVVAHVKATRPAETGRIAIVANEDLTFGMARMFELLAGDQELQTRVFRDPEEARRWVTAGTATIS